MNLDTLFNASAASRGKAVDGITIRRPDDWHVHLRDGEMLRDVMRRNHVSEHDLEEDLRLDAQMEDASKVKIARVERSGDISFIKKE